MFLSDNSFQVLVIGAGPAGLSTAAECVYHRLESVCVLEKGMTHNQTVYQYYPDEKRVDAAYRGQEVLCAGVLCFRDTTKTNFLSTIDTLLEMYPITLNYNVQIDSIKRVRDGSFQVYSTDGKQYLARFVVVGIGRMGKPNRPDFFNAIPPSVKSGIHFDVRNLDATGKDILVVGGGNSAIEFALSLSQKGRVTVTYRKDVFSRLNPMNLQLLDAEEKSGRIRILRNSNIDHIGEHLCKPQVFFKEGEVKMFDHVIFGIGGSSPAGFLHNAGIELDSRGNPKIGPTLETNVENLYVAGELSVPQGKGSIIASFNSGKIIVESIMKKLGRQRRPEMVTVVPGG